MDILGTITLTHGGQTFSGSIDDPELIEFLKLFEFDPEDVTTQISGQVQLSGLLGETNEEFAAALEVNQVVTGFVQPTDPTEQAIAINLAMLEPGTIAGQVQLSGLMGYDPALDGTTVNGVEVTGDPIPVSYEPVAPKLPPSKYLNDPR